MQAPEIAAMTGLRLRSMDSITVCRFGSAIIFGVLNSRMSAPPEKACGVPTSTSASTAASAPA